MNDSATAGSYPALLYQTDRLVLSIGPSDQLRPHVHGAAELRISFAEPIVCHTPLDGHVASPSVLIPPGVRHQNQCADGRSAVLYLDPASIEYQALAERMRWHDPVYVDLEHLEQARHALARIARTAPALDDCVEQLQGQVLLTPGGSKTVDARIEQVLARLRHQPDDHRSIADLADLVDLSEDRLHHLFSAELGIPIHRYRIWHRLRNATEIYLAGATLTRAAHEAGFADSAHFSRTFVNMFGAPPSTILPPFRQTLRTRP